MLPTRRLLLCRLRSKLHLSRAVARAELGYCRPRIRKELQCDEHGMGPIDRRQSMMQAKHSDGVANVIRCASMALSSRVVEEYGPEGDRRG
jgi:hypothetical protein